MLSKKLGGETAARNWLTNLADRIASARDSEDALRELLEVGWQFVHSTPKRRRSKS